MENAWKKEDGPVRYQGGVDDVLLGDRIELKGLLFKKRGIVGYVPGLSEPHPEMEFNGLYWVGITLESGVFTGAIVDPDSGSLRKNVRLVGRGNASSVSPVPDAPFD